MNAPDPVIHCYPDADGPGTESAPRPAIVSGGRLSVPKGRVCAAEVVGGAPVVSRDAVRTGGGS